MSDDKEKLGLELSAEDNGLIATVERVIEALGESGLGRAITAASTAFTALKEATEVVVHAYEAVSHAFEHGIELAAEAETANRKLATSLVLTGNYSEDTLHHMNSLALSMQQTTGKSKDQTKELFSLALSLGMTAAQAEKASLAAMNMAAAMPALVSPEGALRQMNMTLTGTSGRLKALVPDVEILTDAQRRSGAAIDIISAKFKDFAALNANTYAGSVKIAQGAQNEFIETLGDFIVESDLVRESLAAKAAVYYSLAAAVKNVQHWMEEHADTIRDVRNALLAAIAVVAIVEIAMNAMAIATTIASVAATGFGAALAFATGPIGLTLLAVAGLTAAFAYLGIGSDHIIGSLKILGGAVMTMITLPMNIAVKAALLLAQTLGSSFEGPLQEASNAIDSMTTGLILNGNAQIATAEAARKAAAEHKEHGEAIKGMGDRATKAAQDLIRLKAEFVKLTESAKPAVDALKDLSPRIQLQEFNRDAAGWEQSLLAMQKSAKEIDVKIGGSSDPADAALAAKAREEDMRAGAALSALKIKRYEFERDNKIKNVDISLAYEKAKTISADQEIMVKRQAAAEDLRTKRIEVLTAEMINEQEIQRHTVDINTAARLKAREIEITAFKEQLESEKNLAVSSEQEKQLMLAQTRAEALKGAGGGIGAQAGADVVIAQEEERQSRLKAMRAKGRIDEEEFTSASHASQMAQSQAQLQVELAFNKEREDALGLSEDALQAKLQSEAEQYALKQQTLQMQHEDEILSDSEFKTSLEEAELNHTAAMNTIREGQIQADMDRATKNRDYWAASLAQIRLEQEKHGPLIGAIMGVQQTQQFQGANKALGDLANLRNSHSKSAFEIGKKAAIAQATINTFMAATAAYSAMAGIPLVGPILGAIAAAAAVAAGFINIQNIEKQKFTPQAHGGIEEVPQSMDNQTFLLRAGERVVQSDQNASLGQAVDKINNGGAGKGTVINITINGTPSSADIDKMKKAIIDALRSESERGTPIINEKGVVKNG